MKTTNVGLAEGRVSKNPNEVLTAMGLGSCVALVGYDAEAVVAALAHVMLPKGAGSDDKPAKFADRAVPFLLDELQKAGADLTRLRFAVFGGSQMLAMGQSALLEIGSRNVQAVRDALAKAGLEPVIMDVGGTKGRTVEVAVADGTLVVKILGQPEKVFAELAEGPEVQR